MNTTLRLATLCAAPFLIAACGPGEAPKATTSTTTTVTTGANTEVKVEEKPHAPESHGMPGMADLFKGDEKKDEKKDEKAERKN